MFDYEQFENNIVRQMENIFHQWTRENNDIYIFSLDCAEGMESVGVVANTVHYLEEQAAADSEDYWYYKYCEEEWELSHWFKGVSEDMYQCLGENDGVFSDPDTFEYTEAFDEHCEKIMERCVSALTRLRESLGQDHADVLLTFNIRESLAEEDRIEIVEKINDNTAVREYVEHIEEFS